jgi:phosphatidylinositol alpha-1,6-mannosyltransferase
MPHLLVTNDYPPKLGGIQNYLWELWRRLPQDGFTVFTTPYAGDSEWDAAQDHRVIRAEQGFLAPSPSVRRQVQAAAEEAEAELVLFDPAVPVGALGPSIGRPFGVVLHGAEVTVPGRIPGTRAILGRSLRGAELIVSAGEYAAREARRAARRHLDAVVVPPGVDVDRFQPAADATKRKTRERLGLSPDCLLVLSVSRLVPRKGMDRLIEASARLQKRHPDLLVAIAGDGRDRKRLAKLIEETGAPARLLGRVDDGDLPDLYAAADVFAMLCRTRWGGLEQEGFGIVFVEAAAAGVPQIAGSSGGAAEAVTHGETGLIVGEPDSVEAVEAALDELLSDPELRRQMGIAARSRAVEQFSYDVLVARLAAALPL